MSTCCKQRAKALRYKKAASSCVWSGRRGCEMALGRVDTMIEKLRRCTSSRAEEAIAMADSKSRAVFVELQATLKNSLCGLVGAKLQ